MGQDWLGLQGRICAITGGGGGIGIAMGASFATAGARVLLLDRNEAVLRDAAASVAEQSGQTPLTHVCDVTDPDSINRSAQYCQDRLGPCDVLINNAGLLRAGALADLSLADWNALLAVNLTGYFLCAQAFGAQMRAKAGGALVHVASIAGSHPQGFSGSYSVSKAGVVMLSRQIAMEWGPLGIRSNVISPGLVETPMSAPFYAAPGVRERRSAVVPSRRIGQPQDMADVALFLASDRSSYVNGDEVGVNGGYAGMLMNMIPRPGHD